MFDAIPAGLETLFSPGTTGAAAASAAAAAAALLAKRLVARRRPLPARRPP